MAPGRPPGAGEEVDLSEREPKLKVTDRRMFTADGELREDFRHLDSESGEASEEAKPSEAARSEAPPSEPEPVAAEPVDAAPQAATPPPEPVAPPKPETPESPPAAEPGGAPGGRELPSEPSFLDLVGVLAEPIAIFLGDAKLPDGRTMEDLEAARFHIDLLEVFQQKTAGNLSAEESALLEDLLYRLRLRYVQKKG